MSDLLRYVVLHHTGIDSPHYDLLFETASDSALASARLNEWPMTDCTIIERRADHRRLYLDYEGELSGNRSFVRRVASGTCGVSLLEDGRLELSLDGTTIILPPLAQ